MQALAAFSQILDSSLPRQVIVTRGPFPPRDAEKEKPAQSTAVIEAPRGEIESVLAGWWRELLGVDNVGRDDDFFDLGGHSLTGIRLFAKIEKITRSRLD